MFEYWLIVNRHRVKVSRGSKLARTAAAELEHLNVQLPRRLLVMP
jgi:hypothetical protein